VPTKVYLAQGDWAGCTLINKIDFNNAKHRNIFNGKFFTLGNLGDTRHYKKIDPINEYKVDKHGFRSELATSDILVGGCSLTFGVGVPEEATWGRFVGKALNSSVSSIAVPGASICWIIEQIYIYFKTYGHPKKLFCLFPDLGRLPTIVDGAVLSRGNAGWVNGDLLFTVHVENDDEKEKPKYLKKPYDVRATTTYENAAYWSVRYIRMLEQYCNTVGIDFIWSTWDFSEVTADLVTSKEFGFNNYFNVYDFNCNNYRKENGIDKETIFKSIVDRDACRSEHLDVECSCGLDCHSELLGLYGPKNFYSGTDTLGGAGSIHPGIHFHAHLAEAFLSQPEAVK
jgi:hypothetical protein